MTRALKSRQGFALAVAIFAIVVIGGIVAGAFFASNQDYQIGRNTLLQERALAISEYGLHQAINTWSPTTNVTMAVGATSGPFTYTAAAQAGGANVNDVATVRITRLNDLTFWVVSEGQVGRSTRYGARRRTGAILRLYVPSMNFLGALTVRGATRIGGSSQISGRDADPSGWACNTTNENLPGVTTNNTGLITGQGTCADFSCVTGEPTNIQPDPLAANDSTYFEYGGVTFEELAANATKRLPHGGVWNGIQPSLTGSTCNTADMQNWGDVRRNLVTPGACESYFPVIYYGGNVKINGGTGQGILLVGGDLEVTGGFEFYGPVIVKGSLKTTGTGGHFNGGVMAANVDLEQNDVLGNAVIEYSSCAIAAATLGSTLPTPAMQRGWADMF